MDTHILGPRGRNAKGSVQSGIAAGIKFGDPAVASVEIFRTLGASSGLGPINALSPAMTIPGITAKKFPLLLKVYGQIITGFDGAAPVFSLIETNLDDTGSVTLVNLAAFTGGNVTGAILPFTTKVLVVDKKYKLLYTPGAGGTVGEAYFFIQVMGPGLPNAV